jgi:PAS domain S-box-containing protein
MKLKTQITLGVGLLFILIILLSVVGAGYVAALKRDADNILEANYKSLQYAGHMLAALESGDPSSLASFQEHLERQAANITETGEQELTDSLRTHFSALRARPEDDALRRRVRQDLHGILTLNLEGIARKGATAERTAASAIRIITLSGTLCFVIALILLVNLPDAIANPVNALRDSIREIARRNYTQRILYDSRDEFGELSQAFNIMAGKLEEYNNSSLAGLMMEKKRIEALINGMRDPVIGLDENQRVIFTNAEAAEIIGIPQSEFLGRTIKDLAPRNDLIRALAADLNSGTGDAGRDATLKIFAHGKTGYFDKAVMRVSAAPSGEETERPVGHVIILRNVTAYKELDEAKTTFIANVTHEFKTPIASMKMSLQLLRHEAVGPLNEEQRELVDSIGDDADRLLRITSELLHLTEIESGHIRLNMTPVDPKHLVREAFHAARTPAEAKHIRLTLEATDDIPLVMADPEKTTWILLNLVTNAIRYSAENTAVKVALRLDGDHVRFEVTDSGQGIPSQYADHVFDRYFRVPGSAPEGSGLGLAICKELIEAQGGTIAVDTELGRGSTFSFDLSRATGA